jgi:uncharacterized membrane protein YcaP (DUF421 family)
MVGDDRSLTNALCTIATIAVTHFVLSWLKQVSPAIGRIIDGTPLVLLEKGQWRTEAMANMRMQDSEVMATARNEGLKTLDDIEYAILERNGEISIIPAKESS